MSEQLRADLGRAYRETSRKMREEEGLPPVVSTSSLGPDPDPFIARQLAEGEVCYAVWVDRNEPNEIGYLTLKGEELIEDRSRVQSVTTTVVPCDSRETAARIKAMLD
jgi:hypothetical protein